MKRSRLFEHAMVVAATAAIFTCAGLATTTPQRLPYTTIDHPQFVPASQATFLAPSDLLIGVAEGKVAKAYPAAILAQHGVVQDHTADGPIAVTW